MGANVNGPAIPSRTGWRGDHLLRLREAMAERGQFTMLLYTRSEACNPLRPACSLLCVMWRFYFLLIKLLLNKRYISIQQVLSGQTPPYC
jgi:hypothetical protein